MSAVNSSSNSLETTDIRYHMKESEGKWSITLTIDNFAETKKANGEFIASPTFTAGFSPEHKWYLSVYPKGKNASFQDYISIYIYSASTSNVLCRYSIGIIDGKGVKQYIQSKQLVFSIGTCSGFDAFVDRNSLYNKEKNLTINHSLTFCCELVMFGPITSYFSSCSYIPKLHLLSNDFNQLFITSKFSDITILVGDKKIKAHKAVLGARSPVFAAMFEHPMEEYKSDVVKITDIDADVMEELLHYIYTGQCPRLKDMAADILPAADKYYLEELKSLAESCLSTQITTYNAASILCLADTYNAEFLKKKALEFVNLHGKDVINTSGWDLVKAHPQLVMDAYAAVFDQCILLKQNVELNLSA